MKITLQTGRVSTMEVYRRPNMYTVIYITHDMSTGHKECSCLLEAELFEAQMIDLGYTTSIIK